ncbi:hypothetical protein M569_07899 [Genlisea aurea]|uniref:Cell wall hydroxyproline-rich glycoprotein n=1 Tax=Genlisea aurea TaxID=192259 RepID=S8E3R0_9LAMI|nr:hypothetical protein M569_07899 [Genlisea aurea]
MYLIPCLFFFISSALQLAVSGGDFIPDPGCPTPNPRLFAASLAIQALLHSITDDPKGFTANWYGPDVCSYKGIVCAPPPDDPDSTTVAGIDLNHANIAGTLPEELGLLTDLAIFHLNSNRFTGTVPEGFSDMKLLYEFDISNNLFSGYFPEVVLRIPSLKYLDLRFNTFVGKIPAAVFDLKLDAFFFNNNGFTFSLPSSLGNSSVSVLVAANVAGIGSLPPDIGRLSGTLTEIVLLNSGLSGVLPAEIGQLTELTVLDVSFNNLTGTLPESIGNLARLEQLNVGHNRLSGDIPESICLLPNLQNFTYSDNYFCSAPDSCDDLRNSDGADNCIPCEDNQRSDEECRPFCPEESDDCSDD